MPSSIIPILLAGGAGTRLWPVSRDALPKQFLPLVGERSTYQETLARVRDPMFGAPIVITGPNFHFFAKRQAEDIGVDATVVIEPLRRDSAPAIAAATAVARKRDPEAVVLALAADHIILDAPQFRATCLAGRAGADAGRIVTFGIKPSEPEMAEAVVASVDKATTDIGFLRLDPEAFARAPQKSIDYAVMEKTDRAAVVAGQFRWADIGSWDALFDITPPDSAGNVLHGPVVAMDARDCVVHSDQRLTAVVGVSDLVVVSTSDAVMVVPRARAQEVRELVNKLKAGKRPEATDHKRVHRPWGYYESIDMGERFQVKRIVVIPGGTLSLQKHRHRAEHWVVVHGTAEVTIGEKVGAVHENESVYIPIGSVHRLANKGKIALELIEVQTGSYFGEDDIERLDDIYKRT